MTDLDTQLPPGFNITIMHLGRGGVEEDGTLDPYNRDRVERTLDVARAVATLRPSAYIRILWTGGCNRQLDRSGTQRPASEGGAALRYATTLIQADDRFAMQSEENSTSTVENVTAYRKYASQGSDIVVVSDPLHYLARKIQFILWLVFPGRRTVFVELPSSSPDTNWKSRVKHLVSTFITVVGMIGITRGDAVGIQRRQVWLQDHTGH
jgi:hypothetical protein